MGSPFGLLKSNGILSESARKCGNAAIVAPDMGGKLSDRVCVVFVVHFRGGDSE